MTEGSLESESVYARRLTSTERAMNAVRGIVRALRVNSRAVERTFGLSLAQFAVLEKLHESGPMSLNRLARATATHQSSVSVVVRRLVDSGLVSRTVPQNDKRSIRLALTPLGESKLAIVPATLPRELHDALEQLSPQNQRALADALERWVTSAGIEPVGER
jgi:DNA-binding MarR family transcriptional regulator